MVKYILCWIGKLINIEIVVVVKLIFILLDFLLEREINVLKGKIMFNIV